MKIFKFALLPILFLVLSNTVHAKTIYVDNTLGSNCSGNYSVAGKNCTGTEGAAYKSIQGAIDNSSIGDVIYMRGGTYSAISILVPPSKNGSAWTAGNFTTLMSYPGEWAKIDATGLNPTNSQTDAAVIYGYIGFDTGSTTNYTRYWKFSNFEITGGGSGVHMKMDNVKWHYMYIHNNGRSNASNLQSGILSVNPRYSEIKYSYFKDNINSASPNLNMAHIMFDGDYSDNGKNGGKGEAFIEDGSTHSNVIAYNYFALTGGNVGAQHIAIRQKNQQRFGYNDRDPVALKSSKYKDWGDNVHHNIVVGSAESIGMGQDFLQVHNNITDNGINIGRAGDVPTTYHAVVYNNTVKNPKSASFLTSSGIAVAGDYAQLNFYDNLPQRTVHPHISFFNNIADGNIAGYQKMPFFLHWDMPKNTKNPNQDNSDLVLENNLINNNFNEQDMIVGHNYLEPDFSGCELQDFRSISDFNPCSQQWRGVGSVLNWSNTGGGLFLGSTGKDQYITNYAYKIDATKTICNGGRSGNHPYLTGVSLPGYVGATNPNDYAWVSGVLTDLTSTDWLKAQSKSDPDWIEKADSQPGVCKAPPKPPTT